MAGAPLLDQPALVPDREAHVGPRQRVAAHRLEAVRQLGGVGLEELAPRRRAKNSSRTSTVVPVARAAGLQLAAARVQPRRRGRACAVRLVMRSSATEAMAASASPRKPMVATASRSCSERDLAGGMALAAPAPARRRGMPRAVVLDRDRAHAAGREAHGDLRGAGVERVVDQLAHHRGRPLDHLAGGDLADQLVGQFADRAAGAGDGGAVIHGARRSECGGPPAASAGSSARSVARRAAGIIAPHGHRRCLIDFILHVDCTCADFVAAYGAWVYALLFLIIFVETGLVVMPFLPGDSLLFVVGAHVRASG